MRQHVVVRAFPRVHLTLIDVAGITYRRYGGIGFAIEILPIEVESTLSVSNELTFQDTPDARDETDASKLLDRLTEILRAKFAVRVRSLPPQHVGFGSKTALLLAIGTSCNVLCGNPLKQDELKRISGRGGASGVGVNVFFHGGFIVDLGHPKSKEGTFVPSSARRASVAPIVAVRLPFPKQWQVHLFLPAGRRYASGDEVAFFKQNTPIPGEEALRVLAAVYHGMVPAFMEGNLRLLKKAMAEVHATGFKQRELQGQDPEVRYILDLLNKHAHVAAGMSSMGPLVYAIAPTDASITLRKIGMALQAGGRATYIGACNGRNTGYEIE